MAKLSTVSTSTTSDMPMTLSSQQSQKNNFRLCWIASLTKCKEYGMEIKTMHIGRDTKMLAITMGNAVLEQVSKYSYLGHMITEDVASLTLSPCPIKSWPTSGDCRDQLPAIVTVLHSSD
ncbi:hypothetical protein ElyMa_003806100 [Elysia marginata]|uniref:Uncharacterized protein n=1 Tax=Elysia marginata TaxID=1093978 RepID=A0AAV4FCV2_9GAST|nr:hypothetical protein ElyMa_003806100 [Elysia marginata]